MLGLQRQSLASTLRSILWEKIGEGFGEYALGKVECLEVCEFHAALGIAVIRCNLGVFKHLCQVISESRAQGDLGLRLEIVSVSGILKKAKQRLLTYIQQGRLGPEALEAGG